MAAGSVSAASRRVVGKGFGAVVWELLARGVTRAAGSSADTSFGAALTVVGLVGGGAVWISRVITRSLGAFEGSLGAVKGIQGRSAGGSVDLALGRKGATEACSKASHCGGLWLVHWVDEGGRRLYSETCVRLDTSIVSSG